jgi:hypothetical protein
VSTRQRHAHSRVSVCPGEGPRDRRRRLLSLSGYHHWVFTRVCVALVKDDESASRPPSGFWCLNDKMIKELMTFAKCETGKMAYKLH